MKFQTANVFSSNMVLQRNRPVRIFGCGENGAAVLVVLENADGDELARSGCIVEQEAWEAVLPPQREGGPYALRVSCGEETVCFSNVVYGEVWLAGGQSNMELELQNCADGQETLREIAGTRVRFYYTQKIGFIDEQFAEKEAQSSWQEADAEASRCWSAVGFYCAKRISEALNVTVGVIGCNWGGTSASAWMSEETLATEAGAKTYLDDYETAMAGKTLEEHKRERAAYAAYQAEWDKRSQALYAKTPDVAWSEVERICGKSQWPGPMGPCNEYRPSGLYHTMLTRVAPYTLRGFLYYQGESDDHKPALYENLFRLTIWEWRRIWKDETLPFLFVQLPMFKNKFDEDWKHWAVLREAQRRVYETVKHTGMAVILDCGTFNNIHPLDKKSVGERLALQALYQVYAQEDIAGADCTGEVARLPLLSAEEAFGPMARYGYAQDASFVVVCAYAQDGFVLREDTEAEEAAAIDKTVKNDALFELAGQDGVYKPAKAEFEKDGTIVLTADGIAAPCRARYAWTNYGAVTVFGKNGLPLAPFTLG